MLLSDGFWIFFDLAYMEQSLEQDISHFNPAKINGTDFQNRKTVWFDVGVR